MKIITSGRKDIDRFFSMTNVLSARKLNHHPFIVFVSCQIDKVAEQRLKELEHLEEHYEYQASGQSAWSIENSNTEMGREAIREAQKSLENVRKEIVEQEKLLKDSSSAIQVKIIDNAQLLKIYPPETPVMAQWEGQYNSDFMQFTIQDVIDYLELKK